MKNYKLVTLTTVVVVILKRNVTRCSEIYSVVNQNVQVYLDTSQWQATTRVRTHPLYRAKRPIEATFVTRMNSFVMILSSHSSVCIRFDGAKSPTRNTYGTCFLLPSTRWGAEMKKRKKKKKRIETYFGSLERKASFYRVLCTLDPLHRLFTVAWTTTSVER